MAKSIHNSFITVGHDYFCAAKDSSMTECLLSPYIVQTWWGIQNRFKPHPMFISKEPARERDYAGFSPYIHQLEGPLGGNQIPHPSPELSRDWKSPIPILRHLFSRSPFMWTSLSGFLFLAIKQKEKEASISGDITRQSMISALHRMNEWVLNETRDVGNFAREPGRREELRWAEVTDLNFLEELRAKSHL